MVRHGKVDAALAQVCHLALRRDTVIDRHDERRRAGCDHSIKRGLGNAIAFVEAMRDERAHRRAERPESFGEQTGRRDAVDVEVAEDRDGFTCAHRALNAICNVCHAGDDERVGPVAVERGGEEALGLLGGLDAVGDHDARDERRDVQRLGERGGAVGVLAGERPAARGLKRCHGASPPGRAPPRAAWVLWGSDVG